jgi:RpiB/LacA/LacB family sugar-phosphate isomerase
MNIAIGNDHHGVDLKNKIIHQFSNQTFINVGCDSKAAVDYPDHARLVCEKIKSAECAYGILICGSGIGMSIAANKFSDIRASLVWNKEMAKLTKQHNDSNVLCLAAGFTDQKKALEIVESWLSADFQGGRHKKRTDKIKNIEKQVGLK